MTNEKDKTSGKEARDKKAAKGRDERQNYFLRKKKILKWEEKNYSKICLIDGTKGWFKLLGHSAIMYRYHVFPMIQDRPKYVQLDPPNLVKDTDYDFISKEGIISIRSKQIFAERILDAGLKLDYDEKGMTVFKLPRALSKEQYLELIEEDNMRWKAVNRVLAVEEKMPTLAKAIREVLQRTYDTVRKMKPEVKELVGYKMIAVAAEIMQKHIAAERGHIELSDYFREALTLVDELDSLIYMMIEAKATNPNEAMGFAERSRMLREMLEKTRAKHHAF